MLQVYIAVLVAMEIVLLLCTLYIFFSYCAQGEKIYLTFLLGTKYGLYVGCRLR